MGFEGVDLCDLDTFRAGFPHELFRRLRAEAPVWWHPPTDNTPGDEGFWVVSRHAECVAVAGDARFSSQGGGGRDGGGTLIEDLPSGFAAGVLLNMMDDPRHLRLRRLVMQSVGPRALPAFEAELRERATALVDDAVARGAIDLVPDLAAELPLQAVARLLGVPQDDRHALFAWAETTLDHADDDSELVNERSLAASADMFAYGAALLAAKRATPAGDLLSAVAAGVLPGEDDPSGPAGGSLTELEQQMVFNLLIAAGSETTRNSIALGLLELAARPDQWEALRADRSRLPSAVDEMLRWSSSTTYNRRTATVDADMGGVRVRAGDKVTLWWASADRDEDVFADPFAFDIDRHPNPHLAFGHGGHACLGAALARLEMRVLFDVLLDRVDRVEPAGRVEWVRSNKHTGLRHAPVVLHAASPVGGPAHWTP